MKQAKKLFSGLLYVPKHGKVSDKEFTRIMISSVLGIMLCVICLAGLTWAWFSGSVSSAANNITAASFNIQIDVKVKDTEKTVPHTVENGIYSFSLENNKAYDVKITADGTATTGYCEVLFGENVYHTIQIFNISDESNSGSILSTDRPQEINFTVDATESTLLLKIVPQWGSYAIAEGEKLIGNEGSEPSENIINSIGTPPASVPNTTEQSETENLYSLKNPGPTSDKSNISSGETVSDNSSVNQTSSEPTANEVSSKSGDTSSDASDITYQQPEETVSSNGAETSQITVGEDTSSEIENQ